MRNMKWQLKVDTKQTNNVIRSSLLFDFLRDFIFLQRMILFTFASSCIFSLFWFKSLAKSVCYVSIHKQTNKHNKTKFFSFSMCVGVGAYMQCASQIELGIWIEYIFIIQFPDGGSELFCYTGVLNELLQEVNEKSDLQAN